MKESAFQFNDPSLTRLSFIENNEFVIEKGKDIEIQTSINVSNTRISENEAIVVLTIQLGDKGTKAPFFLETEFVAKFKWVSGLSDSQVGNFLNQNAPALLLSYSRPIIAMVTNASRYPAYNIPFINFVQEKRMSD